MVALAYLRLGSLLALASLAAPARAVESLTSASFGKRVQESDLMLVKFFAPWCGHCKAMAPAYEEAAQRLAKNVPSIPLADVDATKEPELAQQQGVRGYPTLKIFRRGIASDYGGPRDANGIVEYMLNQVQDVAPPGASSGDTSGPLMARLCRDQACNDAAFPIIDYSESENKCHCSAHPCWNDNGVAHACDGQDFPYLSFSYKEDGALQCGCQKVARYVSPYIAQVKCKGEHCDSDEFPILDYNTEEKKCFCRAHPCHDLDGQRHDCSDPKFPILVYREENQAEGGTKKICECKAAMAKPKEAHEL